MLLMEPSRCITNVVNSEVYNNLILGGVVGDGGILFGIADGYPAGGESYLDNIWNNIVITGGQEIRGYWNPYDAFTTGQSTSPLAYMDYNVYDGPPIYDFNGYVGSEEVYTLSQMQAQGFETAFPRYLGRFKHLLEPDHVHPASAVDDGRSVRRHLGATVFRCSDHEPQPVRARGLERTGSAPVITQEPQNQTVSVGSAATFSIQVNGSGLFYQWQRSNDGGNTWIPLQGANSASYTTPSTSSSGNGAIFRDYSNVTGRLGLGPRN